MAIQEIESGHTFGLQVRVGQGPGQTRFFAYQKHGGQEITRQIAEETERKLLDRFGHRLIKGRKLASNRSGIPGLRFEWRDYGGELSYLYLTGNYNDATGRHRTFAYSVEKHGFDEVLRLGLNIRLKHGAPALTFEDAKRAIWRHYLDVAGI